MKPPAVGDLNWVNAAHRSPPGLAKSEWREGADRFDWRIEVPPNTYGVRNCGMRSARVMLVAAVMWTAVAFAQSAPNVPEREAAYTRIITQRADRIVAALGLEDKAKAARVRDIIVQQYRSLSAVHDARDAQIKAARAAAGADPRATEKAVASARDQAKATLAKLHPGYLSRLAAELPPEQVDRVKDGMTYGVVQVTYNAYLRMLPELTDAQKRQLTAWLVEAREIAMDEGTSDEKHKVFGKYKGKINNYLSAAGYNLKEAEKNLRKSKPSASGEEAK